MSWQRAYYIAVTAPDLDAATEVSLWFCVPLVRGPATDHSVSHWHAAQARHPDGRAKYNIFAADFDTLPPLTWGETNSTFPPNARFPTGRTWQ